MEYFKDSMCEFSESLVSYLYGEITPEDSRLFETHLNSCKACREEFAGFNQVHDSMIMWREQSLEIKPETGMGAVVVPTVLIKTGRQRSAVAALSEFFNLSPLWLRGASAMAVVLFVSLVLFAGIRIFNHNPSGRQDGSKDIATAAPVVAPTVKPDPPVVEVNPIPPVQIAKKVRPSESSDKPSNPVPVRRHNFSKQQFEAQLNRNIPSQSDAKSQQILSDLGLTFTRDDDVAPRLSDIVGERDWNN